MIVDCSQAFGQFAYPATFQLEINDTSIGILNIPGTNTPRHDASCILNVPETSVKIVPEKGQETVKLSKIGPL
jgi:hypothetical protein